MKGSMYTIYLGSCEIGSVNIYWFNFVKFQAQSNFLYVLQSTLKSTLFSFQISGCRYAQIHSINEQNDASSNQKLRKFYLVSVFIVTFFNTGKINIQYNNFCKTAKCVFERCGYLYPQAFKHGTPIG